MWWEQLHRLGLAVVGVAPVDADAALAVLLARRQRQGIYPPFVSSDPWLRADPRRFWPRAKTVISVAVTYPGRVEEKPSVGLYGLVARSMRGRDYHRLVKEKLAALAALLASEIGTFAWQAWVDTAPPVERWLARRAGLGFFGKNCCLIHPDLGSWFWLGELALDRELPPGQRPPAVPARDGECGSCQRCLEACPTGALCAPYELDPYRCLSYLTQARETIPRPYRSLLGLRLFGCDTCQEVCPYNHSPSKSASAPPSWLPLEALLLPDRKRRRLLAGTALAWRGGAVLARNAAVVLGNSGRPEAVALLRLALAHPRPMVRAHAAWGLGRLGTAEAVKALKSALASEEETAVRQEIEAALADPGKNS
ncbi:MAG: tRNA epoxyqueuosine(34) reductase QueG [Clostridia bacterium]|nr:tRNA epoxyqueuosine(34) reductase QueG [Clostridia bacterium]